MARFRLDSSWFAAAAALFVLAAASAAPAGGNYLIVTAETYAGSAPLNQFVAAKQAMGFTVTTYVAPPGTTRESIKATIQGFWNGPGRPDYLLIVGDTSGSSATATTIPHWIGSGSRAATTDLPYVCMDGPNDWYPDIYPGRFSVTSVAMLQNVVDKTLFVEAGNFSDPGYTRRAALLATDDSTAQAVSIHEYVSNNFLSPAGFSVFKIYPPYQNPSGTQDIADAVNTGCLFVTYFGHSSSSGWWTPSFSQSNVNALTNAGLYGLVTGWSCNTAHFDYDECFGETWQRAANKGAAAYLSASNYVWWGSVEAWESSRRMEKYMYEAIFQKQLWEVGPAWRSALQSILEDPDYGPSHDHTRNIFEEFVLLGDPALLLPLGKSFSIAVTPEAQSVCAPPNTQAVYTVQVTKLGDFTSPVALSASGLPPVTTATFSPNNLAPPYTSTLTISGLGVFSLGAHTITVTGSAPGLQRTAQIGLNVTDAPPAAPTLTSPAPGETGVALAPTFTWEPAAGAGGYDLQVATDAGFSEVVHSASTADAAYTLPVQLEGGSVFFWRVRGTNACGAGPFSSPRSFTTVNMLLPVAYDMLNGETGTYTYYDDTYNGLGNNTQPLAPLSGGVGDLTDGVIATAHWNQTPVPYVSWKTVDPTITFHFDGLVRIDAITLHFDDSNGSGGVYPPTSVTIQAGGSPQVFPVADPAGGEPFAVSFQDLNLVCTTLQVTLTDNNSSRYIMLSEVQFTGARVTGACCVGETCSEVSPAECATAGGEYQGDGSTCSPDPCAAPAPACLIISEVVNGTESGDHPRWVEITNTGVSDFTFNEGGLIVQSDGSSDTTVDIDLTGVTIAAGQSYVINSTAGGGSGAFYVIYGFHADRYTTVPLGDGDDRYIITDTADGGHLIDIYGEFGVDGTGRPWEYTQGYAYRLPAYNAGNGGVFAPEEWFFGGVGSLIMVDLTQITHPATHDYEAPCGVTVLRGDLNCDGVVDVADLEHFVQAVIDPSAYDDDHDGDPYPLCQQALADVNEDGLVDGLDVAAFVNALLGG